ncbi:c-type cytochrome [Ramlibacter albus]|uniref:Cytochrome c n=1 Tax=Ramlibacter albus TaxID=2079448 RepID=A0A923M609_9BURK|nr:c-type cytochrome [Ramlibacter albus]MBC5764020.1 cytochrome c [Ramlibacter albus]
MSRRRSRALAALAALGAAWLLTGCGQEQPVHAAVRGAAPAVPVSAEVLEQGRKVWNYRCYFCHGYSGDAKTLATSYLDPKPRDFTQVSGDTLTYERMMSALKDGRPGTAMKSFVGIISPQDMHAVTEFVRHEFMRNKAVNTQYHTAENGWPNHERNAVAFPFARGDIAIDTPWDKLDETQQKGKRLFMTACITCHDHGRVETPGTVWESRAVSYPRDAYCTSCHQDVPRSAPQGAAHPQRPATHTFSEPDGSVPVRKPHAGDPVAQTFLVHDKAPAMKNPSAKELRGEHLFQKNCAFCHAADGTSKSWIGSFLEPHPRDLTSSDEMKGMTRERLARSISQGLPGTSMPAWNGVMPKEDIDALVAYIAKAFHPVPN